MSWSQLIVRSALEGLAVGLAAAVVRRAWQATGRLDLTPVAAASLVTIVAARQSDTDGFAALALGAALLSAAGLAGAVLAALATEADVRGGRRAGGPSHGAAALLPGFLVLAGADAAARLLSPDGPWPFGQGPSGDPGPRFRGDVLVTWSGLVAVVGALVVVGVAGWLLRRGALARAWRAWRADPDLLALSGVESRRVLGVIGAISAVAGGAAGLAAAAVATTAPADAWSFGFAVALVLVAVGTGDRQLAGRRSASPAPLLAGVVLGTGAAVLERQAAGWGLPLVSALALTLAWARAWRFRRRTITGMVW
jgi:branched-subunit amino acid ABC-type transport system permease component